MDPTKWLESTVVKVGFPVAAAGVLLWFVIFTVNTQLSAIEARQQVHAQDSIELRNEVIALKNETISFRLAQERGNLILQQICVNNAALRDRPNCFR